MTQLNFLPMEMKDVFPVNNHEWDDSSYDSESDSDSEPEYVSETEAQMRAEMYAELARLDADPQFRADLEFVQAKILREAQEECSFEPESESDSEMEFEIKTQPPTPELSEDVDLDYEQLKKLHEPFEDDLEQYSDDEEYDEILLVPSSILDERPPRPYACSRLGSEVYSM